MGQLELKYRGILNLFFMGILFGILGQTSSAAVEPEFVATQIHQAGTPVFGLAWGDFDPGNVGVEVACLLQYGSVLQLSPSVPTWQPALRYNGTMSAAHMKDRGTICVGNVHSGYLGNEVVVCPGGFPLKVMSVFNDPAVGWSNELIFDGTGMIGVSWGARVGDYDPSHLGDEVFFIHEGAMDFSSGTLFSEVAGAWEEEMIYGAEVVMDSAAGEFNPDRAGPEIIAVTEMGPTYEIVRPEETGSGVWPKRTIWDDMDNAGWVVKIADVDPSHPGNELVYGARYNNHILMSRHNGENPHNMEIIFTGNATEYGLNGMQDIAIGDILPQEAGLEILGVDYTGSVYLVRRVGGVWQGQVIWQDPDPLHAVIAGDFLPARNGDEILVAGESGAITLLTLTFTDNLTVDGKVELKDFAELANYWQQSESSADIGPWPIGDGIINILDLSVLADAWLQTAYWTKGELEIN